jgi:hypothetical protein
MRMNASESVTICDLRPISDPFDPKPFLPQMSQIFADTKHQFGG